MRAVGLFVLTLGAAPAVFGQASAPKAEFEVASVKASAPISNGQLNIGVHIDGAMVRCNYLTLRNYLTMAYDVKDYQIVAPDWITGEHYDIVAKLPEGGSAEKSLRGMMASLLADRFKLVMHRETRELPAYALVVAKGGLKVKELPPDPDAADEGKVDVNVTGGGRGGTVVNLGNGSYISYGLNKLEAKKVTFASLMDSLAKFVDRPIVDMTDLKGRYDLTLEYSVDELRSLVRASGGDGSRIPDFGGDPTVSIFSSLEGIGLKLEPRKAPVEVIVIDHAEKTPTAN
jgi:uncharacterized protein (TIGR03435 family)